MTKKKESDLLTAQADAILAAADAEEAKKNKVDAKDGKAALGPLDEKLIASLPAAAIIQNNEKLRDLLA